MTTKLEKQNEGLKTRLKNMGKSVLKGGKGTVIETVAGGASYYALGALHEKVQAFQDHWWLMPGAVIAGGHFMKRKSESLGAGLVFLGGFLLAQGYDTDSSSGSSTTDTTTSTTEGKGLRAGDAGAWEMVGNGSPGDAGALQTTAIDHPTDVPGLGNAGALQEQNAGTYFPMEAMSLQD